MSRQKDEDTRRDKPYYPPGIRNDLVFLDQTIGEACAELCDLERLRLAEKFADLKLERSMSDRRKTAASQAEL
jgi:hypothetical protein